MGAALGAGGGKAGALAGATIGGISGIGLTAWAKARERWNLAKKSKKIQQKDPTP